MNNFKIYRSLFILCFGFFILSCEEETPGILAEKDGPAVIKYIRVTDPSVSDSLLTGAFMGSLIAVVGDNLGDAKELWFNDQKALLEPNFITDKTILVNVPTTVPKDVNDKMRIVFSDKSELIYDFKVNVPGPILSSVKSEYVADGDIMELVGDFFFNPEVIFQGGTKGEVVSADKTGIKVKVPSGAQPGQISVKTAFGVAKSKFYFRDDRNVIVNFDDKTHVNWTAPTFDGANNGVVPVSGKYAMFSDNNFSEWKWNNPTTLWYFNPERGPSKQIATGPISDLALKFEINVPVDWEDFYMLVFFAPYGYDHGYDNASFARLSPWKTGPFKTSGWQTMTVPLTQFVYHKDDPWSKNDWDKPGTRPLQSLDGLTNVNMMMFGPNIVKPSGTNQKIQIAIDNIRVVPIN